MDRGRVVVVLVRARNPQNIGAVARAMQDLGYSRLRVVNEFPVPFQAAKSAVDAAGVLAEAEEFEGVAEAVADCTRVIGTTAVGSRVLEHPLLSLEETAARVAGHLVDGDAKVAVLFGSEKTGLSNEELSFCHELMTIPMAGLGEGERHLSMNLGQAAAVCLYRLGQEGAVATAERVEATAATGIEVERVTGLLAEALEVSGYARRHPANVREAVLRRMVRRMGLGREDAAVWTGILRQMLYAMHERD
jgi:TrmH family RNA methyltransferase